MDPFVMNFLSSTPLFHLPDALFRPKTCRIRTFVVPLQSITGNYRHIRLSAKEWTEKTNAIGIISNDYFSFPAQVPVFMTAPYSLPAKNTARAASHSARFRDRLSET